ncbi:MAG: TIGR00159 family protein [Lentisphaerae bacterium]|nr:TIGR00159 family protein [Lentisphaerota bacterium]MBQ4329616.1 diadenylate cyclase CdaA [Lentisphaeria bacterium]
MNQFIEFITDWRALLQVAIIFTIIYLVMYHLRKTSGSLIMAGLLMLGGVLWGVAKTLELDVISQLLEMVLGSLFLMLMIIFQPELRRLLARLGSLSTLRERRREELIEDIVSAMADMSSRKCGAIVVIERKESLKALIEEAIPLDARVTSLLIESIFFPNSPLHDGAIIIRDNRIVAARAILPLAKSDMISKRLGTRHRATLGIAEESDAVAVMVSEESGAISLGVRGELHRDLSQHELHAFLNKLIVENDVSEFQETVNQVNESALGETQTENSGEEK